MAEWRFWRGLGGAVGVASAASCHAAACALPVILRWNGKAWS